MKKGLERRREGLKRLFFFISRLRKVKKYIYTSKILTNTSEKYDLSRKIGL